MPDVTGFLKDQNGAPITGTKVQLWQFNLLQGLIILKSVVSDATGRFLFSLSVFDTIAPGDFQLRVRSEVGRLLWKSEPRSLLASDWDLGTVAIPTTTLSGWPITNLDPGGQRPMLSNANDVTILIDDHDAWKDLEARLKLASQEVNLQLFLFDVGRNFLSFTPDPPNLNEETRGARLEDVLLDINDRPPPVAVRVLMRDDFFTVFGLIKKDLGFPVDDDERVKEFFASAPNIPNSVAVRRFQTNVIAPFHAKYVVIDSKETTIIGSPLVQEYYNTQEHLIDDRRRGTLLVLFWDGPLDKQYNAIRSPVHDVGLRIIGESAADFRDTFFLNWDNATPPISPPLTHSPSTRTPAANPNAAVQVARTLPGLTYPGLVDGEISIMEGYQRAFHEARDYVYLENQYFLSDDVLDSVRLALQRAKRLEDQSPGSTKLQFIVVLNEALDLPGYTSKQNVRIKRLFDALKRDGLDDRIGLFTVWVHDATSTPKQRIIRTYVHSKVGIVDDKWATVGSANLDGTSMRMTDFVGGAIRLDEERLRSVEVNALIFNGVDGLPNSDVPATLRRRLWSELLGIPVNDPQLATRPADGWLGLWRRRAEEKRAGLAANPATGSPARILPWKPWTRCGKVPRYLEDNGIEKLERFNLLDEVPSFDFDTGTFK